MNHRKFHHHSLDRRRFLRLGLRAGGLTFFSAAAGPQFLERLTWASSPPRGTRRPVLVTIFLRGAMDALMAVPPLDDPNFQTLRPNLAMSATQAGGAQVLDLDGRHGLHPSLAPLQRFYDERRLAIVHGVGSPNPTRSHFDAQDYMESGMPFRKGVPDGWLNRTAKAAGASASPFRAVSLTSDLPRSLAGSEPALAIDRIEQFEFNLPGDPFVLEDSDRSLRELWKGHSKSILTRRGEEMFEALGVLSSEELIAYRAERGGGYPYSRLGQSLMQIAYLIQAGVGLEIAFAESDGWDTHVAQGTKGGAFARQAQDLALSIAAFWNDIEAYHDDVVVLTMTEFGRTVAENGSAGTDHGHGGCLFTLGNRVDGGRVYGGIPELVPDALFEGRDLPVDIDFRAVFSEVAGKLFDVRDDRQIFPGWNGDRLPILW